MGWIIPSSQSTANSKNTLSYPFALIQNDFKLMLDHFQVPTWSMKYQFFRALVMRKKINYSATSAKGDGLLSWSETGTEKILKCAVIWTLLLAKRPNLNLCSSNQRKSLLFSSPLIFFSTLKQRRGWDSGKWHQITWQVSSCETYHFDSVMHTKNLKCLCRPSSEIFREERTGKKCEIGSYISQVELEVLQLGTTTTTLKPRNIIGLFVWSKLEIGLNSFGSVCSMHNSTI